MPKRSAELTERQERAEAWKQFRRDHLFTQRKLAEALGNISRRTIQQVEAGNITPHSSTLRLFAAFTRRYKANAHGRI
jgi:DNA-binding XRE family transcriptional regulator